MSTPSRRGSSPSTSTLSPSVKAYASKCSVIPAERGIDEIYADVTKALDNM